MSLVFFQASRQKLHVSHIDLLYQACSFYCKVVLTQNPLLPSLQSYVNNDGQWQVFLKCSLQDCIFTLWASMPLGQVAEMLATAPSVRLLEKVRMNHHSYFGVLLPWIVQKSNEATEQFLLFPPLLGCNDSLSFLRCFQWLTPKSTKYVLLL